MRTLSGSESQSVKKPFLLFGTHPPNIQADVQMSTLLQAKCLLSPLLPFLLVASHFPSPLPFSPSTSPFCALLGSTSVGVGHRNSRDKLLDEKKSSVKAVIWNDGVTRNKYQVPHPYCQGSCSALHHPDQERDTGDHGWREPMFSFSKYL